MKEPPFNDPDRRVGDASGHDHDRRHDSGSLLILGQKFTDFVERYDRDMGASNEWRRTVEIQIKGNSELLAEIAPSYVRGKWIIGIILIGSIGLGVSTFWAHFTWH
jgi:hypothetical protein